MNTSALRCAVVALALAVLPGSALAQAQPSANHLAIARDVVVSSGMVRSFDTITEPMLAQLQQMNVTRPEIKKDLDQVVESLKPEMELQKQQMVNAAARIYASIMSEGELKEIAAFFKGAAGSKYLSSQPVIIERMVTEMQPWAQQVAEYVMVRVRAELGKRGHQL